MALNADIQTLLAKLKPQVPPPVFGKLQEVFDRLQAAHVGRDAPKVGESVPDVEVTASGGTRVTLASLYRDSPLVLMFYRGRWCPFCDLTLRAFDAAFDEFKAAGARLVAVSPQTEAETEKTGSERGLRFDLFSDPQNQAAKVFRLAWALTPEERELYVGFGSMLDVANGDNRWELPAPAAFVIDPAGVVRWAWVNSNWTVRPEPADVLQAVRDLKSH